MVIKEKNKKKIFYDFLNSKVRPKFLKLRKKILSNLQYQTRFPCHFGRRQGLPMGNFRTFFEVRKKSILYIEIGGG